jgi:hypothetical protein
MKKFLHSAFVVVGIGLCWVGARLAARGYADYGVTKYQTLYGATTKKYALSRPFGTNQKGQMMMEERGTGYEKRHPQGTEYWYKYLQENPEPHYLHDGFTDDGDPEHIVILEEDF